MRGVNGLGGQQPDAERFVAIGSRWVIHLSLARAGLWLTSVAVARAAIGLLNIMLATGQLGISHYGSVALVLSVSQVLQTVAASFGTAAMLQYGALTRAARESEAHDGLRTGPLISCGISLLAFLAGVLLCFSSRTLWGISGPVLALAMFIAALQVLTVAAIGLAEASGHLVSAVRGQLMFPLVTLVGLVVGEGTGIDLNIGTFLSLTLLAASMELLTVSRTVPVQLLREMLVFRRPRRQHWGKFALVAREGLILQGATITAVALDPVNRLVISYQLSLSHVGAYDVIMKFCWGALHFFGAGMRVLTRAAAVANGEVSRQARVGGRMLSTPFLAFCSLGVVYVWYVLDNSGYPREDWALPYALGVSATWLMLRASPYFNTLIGCGRLRLVFSAQMFLAVASIVGTLLLVPLLGLGGAFVGGLIGALVNWRSLARAFDTDPLRMSVLSGWVRQGVEDLLGLSGVALIASGVAGDAEFPVLLGLLVLSTGVAIYCHDNASRLRRLVASLAVRE